MLPLGEPHLPQCFPAVICQLIDRRDTGEHSSDPHELGRHPSAFPGENKLAVYRERVLVRPLYNRRICDPFGVRFQQLEDLSLKDSGWR